MSPERWHDIERLYNAALAIESDQRGSFLTEVCAGDQSLQREVEHLLAFQIESTASSSLRRYKSRPNSWQRIR